jgi:hypothetical protein
MSAVEGFKRDFVSVLSVGTRAFSSSDTTLLMSALCVSAGLDSAS